MDQQIYILGLPLKTLIIAGGLFITSTFLPTIIALIISNWKGDKNE